MVNIIEVLSVGQEAVYEMFHSYHPCSYPTFRKRHRISCQRDRCPILALINDCVKTANERCQNNYFIKNDLT
jgi:hypothetical protein